MSADGTGSVGTLTLSLSAACLTCKEKTPVIPACLRNMVFAFTKLISRQKVQLQKRLWGLGTLNRTSVCASGLSCYHTSDNSRKLKPYEQDWIIFLFHVLQLLVFEHFLRLCYISELWPFSWPTNIPLP